MQKRVAHEKRERANSVDDDVASVVSHASDNDKEVIITVNLMMIVTVNIIVKEVFEKLEQLEFKKSDVIGEALCALIGISNIVFLIIRIVFIIMIIILAKTIMIMIILTADHHLLIIKHIINLA